MKLNSLHLSCPPSPTLRRAFNGVCEVVAFRYQYSLPGNYEIGEFRTIAIRVVTPKALREDERQLRVLSVSVAFDFSAFDALNDAEKEQTVLLLLHQRLLQVARDHNFEITPLDEAFAKASAMNKNFLFMSKRKASFIAPYRSAQLAFSCDGGEVYFFAQVKTARGATVRTLLLGKLLTGPSVLGYLIEDFLWLNENQLCLRFTQAAKADDFVTSI